MKNNKSQLFVDANGNVIPKFIGKNYILSKNALQQLVPTGFSNKMEEGIPNLNDTLDIFTDHNWFPVVGLENNAFYTKAHKQGKNNYTVKFRNPNVIITNDNKIEMYPEFILSGTNEKYQLHMGIYRLVCSNGMVKPVKDHNISFNKGGNGFNPTLFELNFGLMINDFSHTLDQINLFKHTILDDDNKDIYAKEIKILSKLPKDTELDYLLKVRRDVDMGDDLWNTYNVVQENVMRGDFGFGLIEPQLNERMWETTEQFAQLLN